MAARSPCCGASARLRGVKVAGDWMCLRPLVSVSNTDGSNWDVTVGGGGQVCVCVCVCVRVGRVGGVERGET